MEQVREEQIASIYRNLLIGISSTWVAAAVIAWLLVQQGAVAVQVSAIWFAIISLLTIARIVLAIIYARAPDARSAWRKWAWWFTAGTITSGAAWGIGSIFLMAPDRFDLQLLIIVLLSALVYGALASFGRWPPAFFGFFLPAMIPSALWSLAQGDVAHVTYGFLACIWIPSVAWLALRFSEGAAQSLFLSFENAALVADLQAQKDVADSANAAKSRFLAAASHDLRQPVHALRLFVGALKNEKLDAPAARLVTQIDVATASLDELFTALLDVSRLDAGVVAPHMRVFALAPMLKRLVDEARPSAEAKALDMRVRVADCAVRSDPVMLERIVRNLLSNAVRYTTRGGVLVAARRRGDAIAIEVWDTGPGIVPEMQELVFQEFYQTDDKGQAGGLGLGLAIVQRLCALLSHPLVLKSRLNKGSVFRVLAPRENALLLDETNEPEIVSASAPGALVWVIDDDDGAREGMEALLRAWGYDVRAAPDGDAVLAMLAEDRCAPQAILCDYRLGAEDGITLIARLRNALDAEIPAALITADTAPERLREAAASGLPILHKPVSKAKLRALVGNLTRAALPS